MDGIIDGMWYSILDSSFEGITEGWVNIYVVINGSLDDDFDGTVERYMDGKIDRSLVSGIVGMLDRHQYGVVSVSNSSLPSTALPLFHSPLY